jgi:hypothetical protein
MIVVCTVQLIYNNFLNNFSLLLFFLDKNSKEGEKGHKVRIQFEYEKGIVVPKVILNKLYKCHFS